VPAVPGQLKREKRNLSEELFKGRSQPITTNYGEKQQLKRDEKRA